MITAPAPATSDTSRRPALAFVMALVVPGLGHLYAGRALRAIVAMPALSLAAVAAATTLLFTLPRPLDVLAWLVVGLGAPLLFARDAARCARAATGPRRWFSRAWVCAAFAVVGVVVQARVARTFRDGWVRAFKVPGGSMSPAIIPGDHVLIDEHTLRTRAPRRGDVVVYRSPKDPAKLMVHRVVGLPGETVELRAGTLLVNGAPLPEPYASYDTGVKDRRDTAAAVAVPMNGYFVLGDERTRSYDSRLEGPIAASEIVGLVRIVWWSSVPDGGGVRWGRVGRHVG